MKIVNTFLSILVFFLTFIFLYQIIYFGYIDSNKVESYVDNIKLTDKVNFLTSSVFLYSILVFSKHFISILFNL